MKLSTRYQVLFLIFVVLGIYYPVLFGGYNSVDDRSMVNSLLNQLPEIDWVGLFRPSQKFYYRPLLIITYALDGILWGFLPFFMHLENILLHVANTVLVFCLARQVAFSNDKETFLPFFSALLFGLHPIVTESVSWISGRTDLLGTFFVLLSFLTLIQGLKRGLVWLGLPSALFLLLAVMSKELMLFFLPLAVFLNFRWPLQEIKSMMRRRWALSSVYALPFVVSAGIYGAVRFYYYGTGDQGFLHILNNYGYSFFNTFRVFLKVLGFYVKKLFLPLPLNFAIIQVSDHYVWLGGLVLVFALVFLLCRRFSADLLIVSFCLILPAILIALTRVAWTPIAERYLYLPSVFWSIGIVFLLRNIGKRYRIEKFLVPTLLILVLPFGWATASRAMIWQDNLLLYGDTISNSPGFLPLYNEYAVALKENGRISEAEEYLERGRQMDTQGDVVAVHTNQAMLLAEEGRIAEALIALEGFMFAHDGKLDVARLRNLAKACEQIKLKTKTAEQADTLNKILSDVYEKLYLVTKDPFVRYRQAQLAMFTGERNLAGEYFQQAYDNAPASAHYKQAAKMLADKMKTER